MRTGQKYRSRNLDLRQRKRHRFFTRISAPEQQLKVFDKNSVYLPTKKIRKNNPKAVKLDNPMF